MNFVRRFVASRKLAGAAWEFVVCVFMTGCSGSSGMPPQSPPATPAPGSVTPVVMVTPQITTLTPAQSVAVSIVLASSEGAVTSGSVILSSGAYASFPVSVTNGAASVSVPAGVLAPGADTLTASFTPAGGSLYGAATGIASVSVNRTTAVPTVNTSSLSYSTVGAPFRVVLNGAAAYVSETDTSNGNTGIQVFSETNNVLAPVCFNPLDQTAMNEGVGALGAVLFNVGKNLGVAIGAEGVNLYDTSALATCSATGFHVPQRSYTGSSSEGTFDVAITPDGKYAFVANEDGTADATALPGNVGVVQLQYNTDGNLTGGTLVGEFSTGGSTIPGLLISPDGKRLYVTSELNINGVVAGGTNEVLMHGGCVQKAGEPSRRNGLLTVIDVAAAEISPGPGAILATWNAGCSPVRMVETSSQSILYVAARGDNNVLAFSPGALENMANSPLLGSISTDGIAPVGLALFHSEQLLAVANSNRFSTTTQPGSATILSVANPYSMSPVSTIQTGVFPREFTVAPDDATLFLTNYGSNYVQVISTTVNSTA